MEAIQTLIQSLGSAALAWQSLIVIVLPLVLVHFAIVKKFEPLLLLLIAFGMLLINLPITGLMDAPANGQAGGLLYYLYQGVRLGTYSSLILLGIGTMTDFGPLIARPSSLFLDVGVQFGIVIALIVAVALGFAPEEAASIGIIGGADGPTAIYLTPELAPDLLSSIAIAAYSYTALISLIQPPVMRALTTKKGRGIKITRLREVSKLGKVCFPIMVTILCILLLPSVAPLIGMPMLGNLFKESSVTKRLLSIAQNTLIDTMTIFLGVTVGATAAAQQLLSPATLKIIFLGLAAFCFSTIGGFLLGKLMCFLSGGKISPLIGSAGVSTVPIAARVAQVEGQKANPGNYPLMRAMGPNVVGIIGSAAVAGILLSLFQ